MKKIKFITILAILSLLQISCTNSTSGGETLNEKIALYMPDGNTPAVEASIKFYAIGDTSASPVYETQTDIDGRYAVSGISASGYYNVIADYNDSLFTMQDTVFISEESHLVKDDTLNAPGSVTGLVALQPNHSHLLDNAFVIALGMGRAVNVDSTGRFTMTKLAPGDYNLQADTDLENYGPKFVDISITAGVNDTITDTIVLPYGGIPVVTGLSASYDTLHGLVKLSWNKSNYGDIANYLIFRKSSDSLNWPAGALNWVSYNDTVFIDTIFSPNTMDIATYNLDYGVHIRDNSNTDGLLYKNVQVKALSPLTIQTNITTSSFNASGASVDTISPMDTVSLVSSFSNLYRGYKSIRWALNHPDSIVKTKALDTITTSGSDTLIYSSSIEKDDVFFISLEDMGDTVWNDTLHVPVWNRIKPVTLYIDSIFGHTAYLRWTKSNHPRFHSYSVLLSDSTFDSNTNYIDTVIVNALDTSLEIKNLCSDETYKFAISLADSLGNSLMSNIIIDTTLNLWSQIDDITTGRTFSNAVQINNNIYTIGGSETRNYSTTHSMPVVECYNPELNSWSTKSNMNFSRYWASALSYDGKIYSFGSLPNGELTGPNPINIKDTAISIYNIAQDTWADIVPTGPIKDIGPSKSCLLNDKIFTVSRLNYALAVYNYDFTSNNWSLLNSNACEIEYIHEILDVVIFNDDIYCSIQTVVSDTFISEILIYDINLGNFNVVKNQPKGYFKQFCVAKGKLFCYITKAAETFGSIRTLYEFDTINNKWIKKIRPKNYSNFGAAISASSNSIYFMSGDSLGESSRGCYKYEISK